MDVFIKSCSYSFVFLGPNMLLGHRPSHLFVDSSRVFSIFGNEVVNGSLSFLHIVIVY